MADVGGKRGAICKGRPTRGLPVSSSLFVRGMGDQYPVILDLFPNSFQIYFFLKFCQEFHRLFKLRFFRNYLYPKGLVRDYSRNCPGSGGPEPTELGTNQIHYLVGKTAHNVCGLACIVRITNYCRFCLFVCFLK